jgi:hypothetical protein
MKKRALIERSNVTLPDCKKAQKLLAYWKALAIKGEVTIMDFQLFKKKVTESKGLFCKYYPQIRDKFLNRDTVVLYLLKEENRWKRLPDFMHVMMKDWCRKFIRRFQKYFEPALSRSLRAKSVIEDGVDILERSSKLTYRWAAGIVISNHLATLLTSLVKKMTDEYPSTDDIKTLYDILKGKTKSNKLKRFLLRSYRRFEDADKTRNRCAHIGDGEPTKQEIEQSISLAKLLQKYLPRT